MWIRCSDFICITFASTAVRRSDFVSIWIRCSDFICITFSSTAIRRSDFVFCISGVQTSPSCGSDVQTSSASHLLASQIRRSDFAFIWIRCLHLICITFVSIADQTFRLRLLHIRRSDFALIWIRCLHLICITFVSIANQTFRLRLLHRRSDFTFIGSDVLTPFVSHWLASHFRRLDFVFYK